MHHKLNNLKRTIAESTYNSETKFSKSVHNVKKMIDESKVTLRSSEPYIGGEKETGGRIHRYRNKSRELDYTTNRDNLNRTTNKERLLNSNLYRRTVVNKSIENTSIFNASNLNVFMPKRLDSFEDTQPAKITTRETKTRPVSAYIYSKPQKVRIR
jgi:hypothetical protein